jgi:hypothetical protein
MEQVNSRYDRLFGPSHRRIIKTTPKALVMAAIYAADSSAQQPYAWTP